MYKKLRFVFRFSAVLLKKYYFVIALGLVLGIATFSFLPLVLSKLPQFHVTKRIGIVGRYNIFDLPLSIQHQISLGLTSVDPSGLALSAAANDWIATDSGKTYIFTINKKLKWQDGSYLKSSDVSYNFKDVKIAYPDSTHLIIKLPDPFAPLPSVVSRPLFKTAGFSRHILGLGSYQILSYHRNGQFVDTLTLSPSVNQTLPFIKYFFYPTQSQARTAFKLGLINSLQDITEMSDLSGWPNVQVVPHTQTDRYVAVFFNTSDPALTGTSGKNLRLALSYAVDKSRWPEDRRSIGPISPTSWAFNPEVKTYDLDLVKAKQLLSKVEKVPDSFTLTVVPAYLDIADQISKDWERIGLKVNIQVSQEIPDSFQALLVGQATPVDPDQYNLWHSTQKITNLTRLNNPRIDKLLEDGRKTLDITQRKQIYFDFQRYLLEEAPTIFLFYPQYFTLNRI